MLKALRSFLDERFPLKVGIPVALVLFGAPASLLGLDKLRLGVGLISCFLALLSLRIVDDISDMVLDVVAHPERGLVSGKIPVKRLEAFVAVSLILILVLNSVFASFWLICFGASLYLAFYKQKKRVPLVLQPFLVNLVFLLIPIYSGLLKGESDLKNLLLMGLFVWTGAVAHDFAHSVHGLDEAVFKVETFSSVLGPKRSARWAIFLYGFSVIFGILFWILADAGSVFVVSLAIMSFIISFQCTRLYFNPKRFMARRLYVSGFLFFLIPLLSLTAKAVFLGHG